MRKAILFLITVSCSCMLISCNQSERKEIQNFLQELEVVNLSNVYQTDEGIYSVYLSGASPWVYNTFSTQHQHVIVVKEERSFAYLMDDEDSSVFDYYLNQKYLYVFNRLTKKLTYHDQNAITEVTTLDIDNLKLVVETVRDHLEQTGDLFEFDSIFPIINQVFKDIKTSEIEIHGDQNHTISRSFNSSEFLSSVPAFSQHITELYNLDTRLEITSSITNNVFNSVTVRVQWDSNNKQLYPQLFIIKNQLVFYMINPVDENYDF